MSRYVNIALESYCLSVIVNAYTARELHIINNRHNLSTKD